jgi:hypothetical protein
MSHGVPGAQLKHPPRTAAAVLLAACVSSPAPAWWSPMWRKVTPCADIQFLFLASVLVFGIVQPYGLLSCASSSKACFGGNACHTGHKIVISQFTRVNSNLRGHARMPDLTYVDVKRSSSWVDDRHSIPRRVGHIAVHSLCKNSPFFRDVCPSVSWQTITFHWKISDGENRLLSNLVRL